MRGLIADGYPVGVDVTPRTILEYQRRQDESEASADRRPVVISDRTLLDGLAYVLTNLSLGMGYPWSDSEISELRHAAAAHAKRFDLYTITPIEFPLSEAHPMIDLGEDYRRRVEANLQAEASRMGLDFDVIAGSTEERAKSLSRLIAEIRAINPERS